MASAMRSAGSRAVACQDIQDTLPEPSKNNSLGTRDSDLVVDGAFVVAVDLVEGGQVWSSA